MNITVWQSSEARPNLCTNRIHQWLTKHQTDYIMCHKQSKEHFLLKCIFYLKRWKWYLQKLRHMILMTLQSFMLIPTLRNIFTSSWLKYPLSSKHFMSWTHLGQGWENWTVVSSLFMKLKDCSILHLQLVAPSSLMPHHDVYKSLKFHPQLRLDGNYSS